jgi:hypothetical protein
VGAGESIDAVVVRAVRKGAQLVEELLAVPTAHEPERDRSVLASLDRVL